MSVTSTSSTIANTASNQGEVTVALFEVAGQPFGVLAADIEQVRPAAPVTRLAGAPVLIEGLVELSGETLPVLDGRRRLGISHCDVRPTDYFVILRVRRA